MGSKRPVIDEEFNEAIEEKMEKFRPYLNAISGAKRLLIENALWDYCRIDVQLDEINAEIRRVGYSEFNVQGNRVRNQDLSTQHQFIGEKNALLPKILKHLDSSVSDEDELMEFLNA